MLFRYTAIDKSGITQKGEREAEDEKTLVKVLRDEGLLLTAASAGKSPAFSFPRLGRIQLGRVSLFERMIFARNIAVMIGAGLAMTRALEAQEDQVKSRYFKGIIKQIRESVLAGVSFSQSLEPHRKIFGDFFIRMAEAGELSGKLEGSLKLLARQMKRDHDIRAKVRGAMMYPAVILVALIGIGALMLIYVVPTLATTFKEMNVTLPLTTKIIIAASDWLKTYIVYALVGVILALYAFYVFIRSERGKQLFGNIFIHIPVFGLLIKKFNTARMARTLASLITAGLSITRSLEVTGRVLGNVQFQESLIASVAEIERGKPLSEILRVSPHLYPPIVIQMISVGEETGTLSRMLLRIALFFEEDVNNTTKNLSSIIEPVMMVAIGAVVGLFVISIIQPLYSTLSNF